MNKHSIPPPRPLVWGALASTVLAALCLVGPLPLATTVIAAIAPAHSAVADALTWRSDVQWLDDPVTSMLATFLQLGINGWVFIQTGLLVDWLARKAYARMGAEWHGTPAAGDTGPAEGEFITVVIQMPADKARRAELVGHFNFEHGDFMGGRVTAMCLGDGISKLEELGY